METRQLARSAFTLVELLIVTLIIGLVSAAVIPTVINSLRERQSVSAAQIIHSAIASAQTEAARSGSPRGFRLLPDETIGIARLANGQVDPAAPLACNRWVELQTPGNYSEGLVTVYPGDVYPATVTGGVPCLVIEQSPGYWDQNPVTKTYQWVLNPPTSWGWNIRLGERITFGAGVQYTVCGPMVATPATSNPEMFANYGVGPTSVRFTRTYTAPDGVTTHVDSPDFLLVVNGKDDDGDGYADNGWDGVDNNGDPQHLIDEPAEWETETWLGTAPVNAAYQILRRPAPTGKPTVLPSSVVVDLTTWASTHERSRCTVDTWTGSASVIVDQYGKVVWDLPYASLASIGMDKAFLHLWLADRSDVGAGGPAGVLASPKEDARLITLNRNGTVTVQVVNPDQPRNAFLRGIRGERD